MAKVKPSIIEQTGTVGDRVYYTRFGKQFSRSKATSFTDNKSEAQLRQRALNLDDVVFIYAVEFQVEVCQLVACAERRATCVAFDLPDLSDEIASNCMNKPRGKQSNRTNAMTHSHDNTFNYHLYAIVEAANTACVSTLSPDEKKADKSHRNINRRVSPSIFIGTITVGSDN